IRSRSRRWSCTTRGAATAATGSSSATSIRASTCASPRKPTSASACRTARARSASRSSSATSTEAPITSTSPSKPPFDISVLSTLAMKGVLDAATAGLRVQFHATQALLKSIAEGESADVVILTAEGIDSLVQQGKLIAASRVELGSSGVGIAVRAGAPKPDIRSVDALKRALLNAQSVAHSRMGASGLYFAKRAAAQAFLDFLGTAPVQAAMQKNQFIPARRSPRRPG